MQHVLILGAGGKIAKLTENMLLKETDAALTLFLRKLQEQVSQSLRTIPEQAVIK
ncbi:hypothetical protein [Furfurilactobacillus milii]|uniref:hypothetical protein n=1 Tax=Furfurilactobacillus milii TaxID=2888272 RepID=UPI0015B7C835|nr:oxidoreductase [Furfurilactobacillus rossiae]QLE68079.1 oxidoreductase [Furfurilactobacillus rossiae]